MPEQMLHLVLRFLNPVILIPAIIVIIFIKKNKEYKSSAYYQVTKLPYLSVQYNAGRYGEYLIYQRLKHMEANGAKFLFNVYIPKSNGETTEIDVLMICTKGIFVFESKNYSGWIFGSANQKNWYQTLPTGRGRSHKEHFYNPIMQNRSHIKHLTALLGDHLPMISIVVFSDRCTLKNVQLYGTDTSVLNRCNVSRAVSAICNRIEVETLSEFNIADLYNKLYPFTQVDNITKAQHIASIHNIRNGQPTQKSTMPIITALQEEENLVDVETVAKEAHSPAAESADQIPAEPNPTEKQTPKCPRCNGNLVLRTATRGTNAGNQFYGCSNYPRCKYIQRITTETV